MTELLDTAGMWDVTANLPEQVFDAAVSARGLDGLPNKDRIEHIVVLGMGGSGIAGDVLVAAAGPFLPIPVIVSKGYETPAYVGENSLVFAISYSGNTEETVEAATSAAVEGARMVVISSGGELGKLAGSWGVPWIKLPSNIPFPRAGLGAMAIPPLIVLEEIGLSIQLHVIRVWTIEVFVELMREHAEVENERLYPWVELEARSWASATTDLPRRATASGSGG